jgi:hypothetical protein
MSGTIEDNVATNNFSSTGPGGMRIVSNGGGTLTVLAQDNNFTEICNRGIDVLARDGTSTLNLTFTTNTVTVANDPLGGDAIRIDAGVTATDTTTICADLVNNTATSPQFNGIRVRQRFASTTFRLEDYAGGATDDAAVASFLSTNNNGATTSADHGGAGFGTIADCPTP